MPSTRKSRPPLAARKIPTAANVANAANLKILELTSHSRLTASYIALRRAMRWIASLATCYPEAPASVVQTGPHHYIRHPFYVSCILCVLHPVLARCTVSTVHRVYMNYRKTAGLLRPKF
jgi:hypothetical protein